MPWCGPTPEVPFPSLGWAIADRLDEIFPWMKCTNEQAFKLVHCYRLTPEGRRFYRRGQLMGPKGAGKSPEAAKFAIAELCLDVVFDGWALSLPPVVVSTQQNIRKARLDALVGKQISPAVRDSLVEMFNKPSGVVALSLSEDQTQVNDEVFDGVVLALSLMPDTKILGTGLPNKGTPKDPNKKATILDHVKDTIAKDAK